jgi:hypothetical protein
MTRNQRHAIEIARALSAGHVSRPGNTSIANVVDTNVHDTVGFDITYTGTSATLTSKTVPAQAPELAAAPMAETLSRPSSFSDIPILGSSSPAEVVTMRMSNLDNFSDAAPMGVQVRTVQPLWN